MKSVSYSIALILLATSSATASAPVNDPAAHLQWNLTPQQISARCAAELTTAKRRTAKILAQPVSAATFASTALALENTTADVGDHLASDQMLAYLSTSKDVRDASSRCGETASAFGNELLADPRAYALLKAVQSKRPPRQVADRKLMEVYLIAARRGGAALSARDRKTFLSLENQITQMGTRFNENVGNSNGTLDITAAQAAGLPPDLLANGKKTDSGFTLPVNESTYVLFMPNERDPAAREAFYNLYNNRGYPQNVTILEKTLLLREQTARLLGYRTWADYVLDNQMAKEPKRVLSFLNNLDSQVKPAAAAEIEALRKMKMQDPQHVGTQIQPWDIGYYDNQLRKTRYSLDTNIVRSYFPAGHTIDAVMRLYSRILGVRFEAVAHPNVPYPEIKEYWVRDGASGTFLGSVFLDLYPRPGKFAHFANFGFLPTRRLADGSFRPASAMIIGNWPQPAPGKPSLLSHNDVLVFFHEFGHNMATLLSTAPYPTLSGFRLDFVEAPSQMLENFIWDPRILKKLTANADTGKPMPDALIRKLISTRYVNDAYGTTRSVQFATVDMAYHTATGPVDTTKVWADVARRVTPLPMAAGTHPQASFLHLFGYDAGYYGYLWSKVYAQDMFTAFQRGGLESPAVGMRYRREILQPAQTYEPDVLIKRFLGRPMDPRAFYSEFKRRQP